MIARHKRHVAPRSRGFDMERGHAQRRWLAGCAGKARYSSEAAADAGIGLQLGAPALGSYHCDECDGWHLTERRAKGQRKSADPVHVLAFVCSTCRARHADIAASPVPWTPERRRVALLDLEPRAIRDGWSIGVVDDHCPACAAALGIETLRRSA